MAYRHASNEIDEIDMIFRAARKYGHASPIRPWEFGAYYYLVGWFTPDLGPLRPEPEPSYHDGGGIF